MVQPLLPSSLVMLETSKGNLLNHDNTTLQTEELVNRKETERKTKKEMKKLLKATVEITPEIG